VASACLAQYALRRLTNGAGPRYRDLVLGAGWTEVIALAAAYVIAVAATPAGISGAVLLLPFQVSVLGTPSPAVTPTNLLYNVVATPGALYRYWRQGQTGGRLALVLIAGTLPGVIAGSVIRVELLPGPHVFDVVAGTVLAPLGLWLTLTRPPGADGQNRPVRMIPVPLLLTVSAVVGCVGGIYGIGGGSILAPVLIGSGRKPPEVAPAALASTFVTSVAGVITFTILAAHSHGSVAPDWPTGVALGTGGLAGAYTGARIQARLPDALIRRLMGILVIAIGTRYLWSGLT
jgi:uncharacterized membrane protein YfcA